MAASSAAANPPSRRLSRALTVFDALRRLKLLQPDAGAAVLHIHILGCDRREEPSTFVPLRALLAGTGWRSVQLLCCGPNCVRHDEWSLGATGSVPSLTTTWSAQPYEELQPRRPHLALAFNAGVWGYTSWAPVLRLCHTLGCPLVVTSYNELEAEEDEAAIDELGLGLCWLWRPEANPWRSLVAERGRRVAPHPQYENSYSQCLVAETVWIDALHTVLKVDE